MVTTRRRSAAAASQGPDSGAADIDGVAEISGVNQVTDLSAKAVNAAKGWAETAGTGNRKGAWGLTGTAGAVVSVMGATVLMAGCPAFAILMWFTLTKLDGSVVQLYHFFANEGLAQGIWMAWPRPGLEACSILVAFGLFEAALQLLLPGSTFKGPVTPQGNVPVYRANGVQSLAVTQAVLLGGWQLGLFDPGRVYDLFGEMLSALNIFALLFCAGLYLKGRLAPSSTDCGSNGLIYDFFWGLELYPRIGGSFDLKTWTNCRMGMMGWAVWILCFAIKQRQAFGHLSYGTAASVLLMELYIFKFFLWETGYWCTMDIMHDRAGYYLCWGCLVWVPAIYTSPVLYLTEHQVDAVSLPAALAIAAAGTACVYINYDSDRQRQVFRASNGKTPVWGRTPKKITAHYTTGNGEQRTSLLLASGWWGLSRHFHYLPEILASCFWSLPALKSQLLPWFYVFYLTLLLTDRAFRDEARCASKYGTYWQQYCKAVPYRMVPYLF